MGLEPTLHTAALLGISVLVALLAAFAFVNREVDGAEWMVLGLAGVVVWTAGSAVVNAATTTETYVLASKLMMPGIAVTVPCLFAFVVGYSGYDDSLTPVAIGVLFLEPVVTSALMMTNEAHGLMYTELSITGYSYGWWFWVHFGYDYLLVVLVTVLLLRLVIFDDSLYRGQAAALVVGVTVPWVSNVLWLFPLSEWVGFLPTIPFDPTPVAFAVTGTALAVAGFRSRLLDIAPVTREAGRTVLIESMDDGVLMVDGRHRVVDANPAISDALGVESSDAIGQHLEALEPALDRLLPSAGESAVGEVVLETDGRPRHYDVRVSPLAGSIGDTSGWVVVLSDVTDRKERIERLERYETVIEASGNPIYSLSPDGRIAFVNRAAEEITGYDEAELVDERFERIVAEDDRDTTREIVDDLIEDDERRRVTFEMTVVAKDGERVDVENNLAVLGTDEEFDGTAGVVRDIRDRKHRQEVLTVLNRALRHNLRTHVNTIDGYAELVSQNVDGEDQERLELLRESADWLGRLGSTLRSLQQAIEEGRESDPTVDLQRIVDEVAATHRRRYPRATIEVDVPSAVSVDAGKAIKHAFAQILENAIVHNDRGDPTVRIRTVDAPQEGWVDLCIEDDGPGLPETERAVVLGEASTDQLTHGSGVGLWVARWIAEVFDGELLIAENDPRGTVVTSRLRRVGEREELAREPERQRSE
jgi:PAS domain S-box-containing protein